MGVIVVAAGSGSRLGATEPKAFVELGGRSILARALESVFGATEPAQVVVVAPISHIPAARTIAARVAGVAAGYVTVVAGGATRQASVAAGLAELGPSVTVVLVHDAARVLASSALFDRVAAAVTSSGCGVIPSLPVSDTIKQISADSLVHATVDRSDLVIAQTPQGFPRAALDAAYAGTSRDYSDDAALFAAAGNDVTVVAGEALAFKITTAWDLRRAENVLDEIAESARAATTLATSVRTGIGIDVHAYDASEPLWLGGLYWPDEVGLAGHSDGDAMCHAICDALLSAAGLGDIGGKFGTDDPRFAGAHGDVFIAATVELVRGAGYTVGNVSVQLVAKHPRLGARRVHLEAHLSELVGAPVSVAATTSDGLGFTGKGEGVAVIATVLLQSDR